MITFVRGNAKKEKIQGDSAKFLTTTLVITLTVMAKRMKSLFYIDISAQSDSKKNE